MPVTAQKYIALNSDSLEVKLILAEEAERLQMLIALSEIYLGQQKPDLALEKSKAAITLARRLGDARSEALALMSTANSIRYLLSDYESALSYCVKALKIAEEKKLLSEQAEIQLLIGEIYLEVGNSFRSIEHYMQALALVESLGQYPKIIELENKIGQVYAALGNDAKAIEYHKKGLRVGKLNEYVEGVAESNYWLAVTYSQIGNLDLAMEKQMIALHLYQNLEQARGQARSYFALGKIYMLKTDYNRARAYLEDALQLYTRDHDDLGRAQVLNQIGVIEIERKSYESAIQSLHQALALGEQLNNKKIIRDSYEYLYNCYAALRDYEKALQYKDLFVAISDFIYGEESERRMAELQNRFEIEQKESQIEGLRKDNELRELALQKQTNFRNFLIICLLLMVVIVGLVYYLYRAHKRNYREVSGAYEKINVQNGQLQELNATKDKFFSIISHDLKGPLNSLTSFSGLLINHTDSLSKQEIQMLAKDLDKSLKNLLALLNNLLAWARAQSGNLDTSPENLNVQEMVYANAELLQRTAENKEITLKTKVPAHLHAYADKNQMNTVLRNLMSNALKFTNTGGTVQVEVSEWQDAVEIAVTDNGIGMPQEVINKLFKIEHKYTSLGTANEKGTGLGLMLCKEFVERSGGKLFVESTEGIGSTFRFTVPTKSAGNLNKVSASAAYN
jgi:signal transduction histidine kinase